MMLYLLVTFIVFEINISKVNSDWVKISDTTAAKPDDVNSATKSFLQSDLLSDVLSVNVFNKETHPIIPSKEWIEYQKQRFDAAIKKKDIFVGPTNIKNSARIVVPILINSVPSKKNLYTSTTTKIDQSKSNITIIKDSLKNIKNSSINSETIKAPEVQSSVKTNSQQHSLTTEESEVKGPSFQRFIEFLKSIQDNLITKTSLSIKDKIEKLAHFRDELLVNIEEHLSFLWPKTAKTKRSISDEAGIEFPTAETALMTISFLTFAVFLIKLVLQVIHTIKSKHYNLNAMTMEPVQIAKRSNARLFGNTPSDLEMTENVLKAIEDVRKKFT